MITKDIAELIKAIQSFAGINSYEVFSDFVELAALSTMQAFELNRQKELAEQINSIQKKYNCVCPWQEFICYLATLLIDVINTRSINDNNSLFKYISRMPYFYIFNIVNIFSSSSGKIA